MSRILLLILFSFLMPEAKAKDPIRVGVIDTGMNLNDVRFKDVLCKTGHKDFTNSEFKNNGSHGTHIAGLIKQYAGDSNYCLVIYKIYSTKSSSHDSFLNFHKALAYVVKDNINIVNYSGGGRGDSEWERKLIESHPKIKFIVAAGNDGNDISDKNDEYDYYPAQYNLPNMTIVGNWKEEGTPNEESNYGSYVVWEIGTSVRSTCPKGYCNMTGSSQATAIRTGKYIYEMCH